MNHLIGSIALIAGTSIGAGMLTLPLVTATMGFWPSIVAFLLICAVMIYVGLLTLEMVAKMPRHTTLISIAEKTFGFPGKIFAVISYFFLLFALDTAYLGGASELVIEGLGLASVPSVKLGVCLVLMTVLCLAVSIKAEYMDKFNRFLVFGMIGTYLLMMVYILPGVEAKKLSVMNWSQFPFALPLISTAFGYHIILPNIFEYLNRNIKMTRKAIILGSSIPLVVYLIWQLMVLGTVPVSGENSLLSAYEMGLPATVPLADTLGKGELTAAAAGFAFFAILTSFLGTFVGIIEFLMDTLKIKKESFKIWLALLAAIPILLLNLVGARIFIVALGYGGVMVAALLGLMPASMTAISRFRNAEARGYRVWGGYPLIFLVFIFFLFVIAIELGG